MKGVFLLLVICLMGCGPGVGAGEEAASEPMVRLDCVAMDTMGARVMYVCISAGGSK